MWTANDNNYGNGRFTKVQVAVYSPDNHDYICMFNRLPFP